MKFRFYLIKSHITGKMISIAVSTIVVSDSIFFRV